MLFGYMYVCSVAAGSTANASNAKTLELKSYSCNTMELVTKLDSGDFLEFIGTDGESKPFEIVNEAFIMKTGNEKPAITGMYIYIKETVAN